MDPDPPRVSVTHERRHVWASAPPEVWRRFDELVEQDGFIRERLLGAALASHLEKLPKRRT